jgi:capsular exopolysaccharide synthesis family protein
MDIAYYLGLLRRRWLPILLCLLAGAGGAVSVSSSQPKEYQASSRLFVNIPAARDVQQALQGVQLSSQLLQSFTRIAVSRTAAERVAARMDPPQPLGSVLGRIGATAQQGTLLIDVSAVDTNPVRARDLANAAAQTLTELIAEFDPRTEGTIAARIIDPAVVPSAAVRPKPRTNLALGLAFGLGVGIALALLLEALDRTIKTTAQVESAYGAPVLASLPRQRRLKDEPLVNFEDTVSTSAEAYRSLRTSLRFLDAEHPLTTILFTSAEAGEGKTTVASNIASAIAQAGERVIVIDADLRRSRLAAVFAVPSEPGLTSVVFGEISLEEALRPIRPNLQVLPPGPAPKNHSEVLGSEAMARLLVRASELADVVVIDAPPVLPVTDATVLAAVVDGVVLVNRFGSTTPTAADAAAATMRSVGATIVGVVINGSSASTAPYYRRYQPVTRTAG